MNNLKMALDEKDILIKKMDMLVNEFETANTSIKALENTHDGLIFDRANTDASLAELTASTLQYQSLRRVIADIENNLLPAADQRVEFEEEAAREDIRTAQQILYDKCKIDIQVMMTKISKLILTFDAECEKIEAEVGFSTGQNLPIFYIPENDRIQFTD